MVKRLGLVALAVCGLLTAQTERGNIAGLVTDSSGAAVPGAQVVITHRATNTTVKLMTASTGEYNAAGLNPGDYAVEVTAQGFRRFSQQNLTLIASGSLRIDVQLQVGAVSETVEVTAAAAQVQADNARASTSVNSVLVDSLPLVVAGNMRTPLGLVAVAAEARGSGNALRLGGGQGGAWNASLDGISVGTNRAADMTEVGYNTPSVEAITEFTVDVNGFKAEYGQAGGGVMTFVSKSGTNAFHGGAFDFLRNEKLDANSWFSNANRQPRGVYKQNDFGAYLGGPVRIPKIYNGRDKTFFHVSYEAFRNRVGATGNILSVPTPEMWNGDFSKWVDQNNVLLPIFDPTTTREASPGSAARVRTVFPNNQIPTSMFSKFAQQIAPYGKLAVPNRGFAPGTSGYVRNNYVTSAGTTINPTDKGSVKLDHVINDKQRLALFASVTANRQEVGPGGPPGLPMPLWNGQVTTFDSKTYRATHTWSITPRLLNSFSFGYNDFAKDALSPNAQGGWKDKVCLKHAIDCDVNFPAVSMSDYTSWGSSANNGTFQPLASVKNDLSYYRGKHNLKFGYNFDAQHANGFGQQTIGGSVGFNRNGTAVPASTTSNPTNGGNGFASMLLGWVNDSSTETVRFVSQRYPYHGFYAQDDWRVTRKLTINIGLRYDMTLPPVADGDKYADFTPDKPNARVNNYPGALRFAGTGDGREGKRSLVPGWYGGWGPRLGIAYSPDSKTAIRTAFGRSFSRVTVVGSSGHYDGFARIYTLSTPDTGITPAFLVDAGPSIPYILPPVIDPTISNNADVHHWQPQDAVRAPESLYWTLSIQRQLTANLVVEAGYNAMVGTHLQSGQVNINQTSTPAFMGYVSRLGETGARDLFNADISSAVARNAGVPIPYANFTNPSIQVRRTVNQALRPFPQYNAIVTGAQGGDKSGHSSYHAMVIKADRRFSQGLTFQWNYVLSKLITDSENYAVGGSASDQYNRRLDKGLSGADQTHVLKLSTVYELPFFKGKRFLGGWRLSAIQVYASGTPVGVSRNNALPLNNGSTRPFVNGYDNWRAPIAGEQFDPAVDRFLDRSAFPATQPSILWGNMTRNNPNQRSFPSYSENVSFAKTFRIKEAFRADFRWEAFNVFNRHQFGVGNTSLDGNTFGLVTSASGNREMQVAIKLYW
jgi:hypothetical protein